MLKLADRYIAIRVGASVGAAGWMEGLALARLFGFLNRREPLARAVTMLTTTMELLLAICWTVYYILEAAVRLLLPPKAFHKDIAGQVVLVTGGGSGIGRLMCLKFARLGATVVTWDINTTGNAETAELVGREGRPVHQYTVDMADRQQVYEAARLTREEVGVVSILVNNAGIVSGATILDTPDSRILKTFDVNVLAHFWTIKAFLPDMLAQKQGHVVNVASLAGQAGTNKLVDYCASKFAAVGLDEAFRVELMVQGHSDYIKTTAVCPYYISTGMFSGVNSKIIPILKPEFVAESVVEATLANRELVLLPWWTMFLFIVKHMVPSPAWMRLSSAVGSNCSMDQFTGKKDA